MIKAWIACLGGLLVPSVLSGGTPDVKALAAKCQQGKANECAELVKLARRSPSPDVQQSAIGFVTDPAVLAEIARRDLRPATRAAAVARVEDQAVLAAVIRLELDDRVREIALGRFTDQAALAEIARTHSSDEVRAACLQRLTDQAVLTALAIAPGDEKLRLAALGRITDQAALARIGGELGEAYAFPYKAAPIIAKGVTDPKLLVSLATSARSEIMKSEARAAIVDQPILAELAKRESDGTRAWRDVRKISDQPLLADLAQTAVSPDARIGALRLLRDVRVLAKVAETDRDARARKAATLRLLVVEANVTVTGTLVEEVMGPVPKFDIALSELRNSDLKVEAVTGPDGGFHFEALAPGEYALEHAGSQISGPKGSVYVTVPAYGRLDMGAVPVQLDKLVTPAFGTLCDETGPARRLPAADLVVFTQRGNPAAWKSDYAKGRSLKWRPPWKAALCIITGSQKVGDYVDNDKRTVGAGYASSWQVRLVRLDTGQSFEKSVYAAPPSRIRAVAGIEAGGSGDPTDDLVRWLQTIK
jgi:hypothetical protein